MLKNIVLLPLFIMLLSGCSVLTQEISGSQKIQVRVWKNASPNMLPEDLVDTFALDVDAENIIEFDVKVFGETVYVVYTTDQNVQSVKYPNLVDGFPAELKEPIPVVDPILSDVVYKYSEIETISNVRYEYSREITTKAAPPFTTPTVVISESILFSQKTQTKKGVWVRMFKGTLAGTDRNPVLNWENIIMTDEPMEIENIKILPLNNQMATILAVTNKSKVVIFNDDNQDGVLDIIEDDFLKRSSESIDQINTWVNGTKTYISLIVDNRMITGYYQNLRWTSTVDFDNTFTVENMQVKMGSQNAYGIWMDNIKKELTVAVYQDSADVSRRWLQIDNLDSIKNPKLNISTYKNSVGIHEDIYIGTVNQKQNFFQLFNVKNLQTYYTGPIISGWNERYAITGNFAGQLLYVRSNFDQQLIFAGLNAFKQWDPIQIVSPPPVSTHPSSPIEIFFLNNTYSLTVFKQENGSIYFLAGVR